MKIIMERINYLFTKGLGLVIALSVIILHVRKMKRNKTWWTR
jgi:hypothetical protein